MNATSGGACKGQVVLFGVGGNVSTCSYVFGWAQIYFCQSQPVTLKFSGVAKGCGVLMAAFWELPAFLSMFISPLEFVLVPPKHCILSKESMLRDEIKF